MLFHPLQLAYPPHLLPRHQQPDSASGAPIQQQPLSLLQAWYPHPPAGTSGDHPAPFPAIPPAPADFASPIPLGPMVAVQSLFGFPEGAGQGAFCWDPVVGMFRGTTAATGGAVFEQVAGEAANAA
jgi:hypothetical protein